MKLALPRPQRRQGSILVVVMLAMLVMASFALSFASQTTTDTTGTTAYWQVMSAMYAAESGLHLAMKDIPDSLYTASEGDTWPASGTPQSYQLVSAGDGSVDLVNISVSVLATNVGSSTIRVTSTGVADETERMLEIEMELQ